MRHRDWGGTSSQGAITTAPGAPILRAAALASWLAPPPPLPPVVYLSLGTDLILQAASNGYHPRGPYLGLLSRPFGVTIAQSKMPSPLSLPLSATCLYPWLSMPVSLSTSPSVIPIRNCICTYISTPRIVSTTTFVTTPITVSICVCISVTLSVTYMCLFVPVS